MAANPRSRPERQPGWRPGQHREAHPARRWVVRLGWTIGAAALFALFVWLLWSPAPGERSTFATLTVDAYDPGELPPPGYAQSDRTSFAALAWRRQLDLGEPLRAVEKLRAWTDEADTFVCYVSAHVALHASGEEARASLLTPDFRRASLEPLLADGPSSARIDLRDLLAALAGVKAQTKVLLIDGPRAQAEPWLTTLDAAWDDALLADVQAAADERTWVIVAAEPRGVSRLDHQQRRSQFAAAVNAVFEGKADSDADGEIDLADLRARVTEVTGQSPFVAHRGGGAEDRILLERPLKRLLADSPAEPPKPAADAPAAPKDGKEVKAPPPDAVTLAWQASDTLWDAEQKLAISPVDYAPDIWHELQSILVWHEWTRQTDGRARQDAPFEELVAAQKSLALDPQSAANPFRHAALAPFRAAIDRFAPALQAWQAAPVGYRFAVRRRNLLMARVPEYWRWKAACGAMDEAAANADLTAIKTLCGAIDAAGQNAERANAAELAALAKRDPIDSVFRRVTSGLAEEVSTLCDRRANRGKIAPLDAPTQHVIEQLLFTSLPNAADRARLWNTLHQAEAMPGATTREAQEIVAQARWETTLARFQTDLAGAATLPGAEALGKLSGELEAATTQLAAANSAAAGLDFARRLSTYQNALEKNAPGRPGTPAEELFARAADAMVDRPPDSETMAPLPAWRTRLDVAIDHPTVDLGSVSAAPVVVTLRTDDDKTVPVLRIDDVPDMLRVEHAGKLLVAGTALSGSRFEIQISAPQGISAQSEAVVRGAATVLAANGRVESRPVEITVKLPRESEYELAPLEHAELVRAESAALTLLAFPQRLTSYALGVKQTAGAPRGLRAALYEFNALADGEKLPVTMEEFLRRAQKLDVQVEVAPTGDVRALKFLPPAPPPPPAAAAAPAVPAPDPNAPIPLADARLAIVLDELDGDSVVRRHLKWLEIEPIHPDRFVAAPTPRVVSNFGQQKIEVPIQAEKSVEGQVAIPADGVPYLLSGSAAFKDADFVQGAGRLTRDRIINAKVDIPEETPDTADARLLLSVSGYPRAFMWNVLPENGAIEPFRGARVSIRQPVPAQPGEPMLSWLPNRPIDLQLEVDSDDKDGAVLVELRMLGEDGVPNESPDAVVDRRSWRGTRAVKNQLQLDAKTGQLGIRTDVADFAFALDPSGSQGRAEIVARIEDRAGGVGEIAEDRLELILDGTPPEVGELAQGYDLPLEQVIDKPLKFAISVSDRLSGPKTLLYWIGTKPRRTETGEWNPPGLEAKLETILSEDGAFQDREFLITLEKVPEAEKGQLGSLRMFFVATDNAGNVMEEPRPLDLLYATQAMPDPNSKGKPRDVIVKVNYRRGTSTAVCRDAKVELMGPGGMAAIKSANGDGQGEAVLKQVMPGEYTVKASGTTNNMPGKGEQAIQVPDMGEGPIRVNITLQ